MNKAEMIAYMAEKADIKKTEAEKVLNGLVKTIVAQVKSVQRFSITGLGSFTLVKRKARKGRNPRTGEAIKIAASKTMKFKAGKAVDDMLN